MTKESMPRRNSHKLRQSANHNAQLAAYYANAAQEEAALANYYDGHKCADNEHMQYGWGFDGSDGECVPNKKTQVQAGKGVRSTGYYDGEMSWPEFKEGFKQKVCSVGPIKSTFNNFCAGAGPQYFDIDNTKYEGHKGQLERCVTGFNGDEVCETEIRAGGICDRDESDWEMFVPAQKDMETLRQICARNDEDEDDEIAV